MNRYVISVLASFCLGMFSGGMVSNYAQAKPAQKHEQVQTKKCDKFAEFKAAVLVQYPEMKFEELTTEQVGLLQDLFGVIPTPFDKVVVMHNDEGAMIFILNGACIAAHSSQAIDWKDLGRYLGIAVDHA